MIGGQNGHQRIALRDVANVNGGEGDGGGSVASNGFGQNAFASCRRELFLDGGGLLGVRDGPDTIGGNKLAQSCDSLLEHGIFADDVQ